MKRLSRILPDRLAGRFALLLVCALLAANLVALALFTVERGRLDRAARKEREIERIVSLVPAIEAAEPRARRAIARDASTRFSRLSVAPRPSIQKMPTTSRSLALTRELSQSLAGREVRGSLFSRRGQDAQPGRGHREAIAVSIRLRSPEGSPAQWLNILSRGQNHHGRDAPQEVFFIILALSLVSVLGVGLIFVRRLTQPLAALATAARAAGQGDRTARVPETGAREMREAAAAFNDMQARIAQFDTERMRTLAAVGHDLRTPITSLRIRAEMLEQDEAQPMVRTLNEMTVMADGLVAYAKGAADNEKTKTIEIEELLQRICSELGGQLTVLHKANTSGRPVALGRAFGNLIDNALSYGGSAAVWLDVQGREAVVTIDDDGPGIARERLNSMFEPFVRGDDSRSIDTGGAGLGLAIARNIIVAHGGEITLANRPEGGLRVEVRLTLTCES